ncbi:MAG: hypothetical protein L6290_02705 [Thermodesulfovibrionales bacterium]|nr:hypothetical protein [Thermodesulfovibrionales bacterium]
MQQSILPDGWLTLTTGHAFPGCRPMIRGGEQKSKVQQKSEPGFSFFVSDITSNFLSFVIMCKYGAVMA